MIGIGDIVVYTGRLSTADPYAAERPHSGLLNRGEIFRVVGVESFGDDIGIVIAGRRAPSCSGAFSVYCFRKVLPADPAFIEQIRKLKPHRKGVEA